MESKSLREKQNSSRYQFDDAKIHKLPSLNLPFQIKSFPDQSVQSLREIQNLSNNLDDVKVRTLRSLSLPFQIKSFPDQSVQGISSKFPYLDSAMPGLWSKSLTVQSVRRYSTSPFSHLDSSGRARMVDVSRNRVTERTAIAECRLNVSAELVKLLKDGALPKGDALGVARVAGVLAAKRTSEIIPLCHPLPLDCVLVSLELPEKDDDNTVYITCEVRVTAKTGAEMEALSGCSGAALALYDMCKAVDKEMVISGLRVVRKTGGKSDYPPPKLAPSPPAETTKPVDWPKETFAPINVVYL